MALAWSTPKCVGTLFYDENPEATRFILCSIEAQHQTKEIYTDLWSRDNQNLSNMPFEQKKDRKSKDKRKEMGYRNGLYLNHTVVNEDSWTIDKIKARTDMLVQTLKDMYRW